MVYKWYICIEEKFSACDIPWKGDWLMRIMIMSHLELLYSVADLEM